MKKTWPGMTDFLHTQLLPCSKKAHEFLLYQQQCPNVGVSFLYQQDCCKIVMAYKLNILPSGTIRESPTLPSISLSEYPLVYAKVSFNFSVQNSGQCLLIHRRVNWLSKEYEVRLIVCFVLFNIIKRSEIPYNSHSFD